MSFRNCFSFLLRAAFCLAILSLAPIPELLAAVTNKGTTKVQLSARRKDGLSGSWTLEPGQSMPIRDGVDWIQHIPVAGFPATDIRIEIVEPNGKQGSITTPGGKYTLSEESNPYASPVSRPASVPLQPGSAVNESNITVELTLILRDKSTLIRNLLPGQTIAIPPDVAEVQLRNILGTRGDENIGVVLYLPDGRREILRAAGTSVRVESN